MAAKDDRPQASGPFRRLRKHPDAPRLPTLEEEAREIEAMIKEDEGRDNFDQSVIERIQSLKREFPEQEQREIEGRGKIVPEHDPTEHPCMEEAARKSFEGSVPVVTVQKSRLDGHPCLKEEMTEYVVELKDGRAVTEEGEWEPNDEYTNSPTTERPVKDGYWVCDKCLHCQMK